MLRYALHRIRWALTGFYGFSLPGNRKQKWMPGLKRKKIREQISLFRRLNQFPSLPLENNRVSSKTGSFQSILFRRRIGLSICVRGYLKFSTTFRYLLRSALDHLSLKHGEDWADQWKKPEDNTIKQSQCFATSRGNQQMKNSNTNSVINF